MWVAAKLGCCVVGLFSGCDLRGWVFGWCLVLASLLSLGLWMRRVWLVWFVVCA